MKKYIHRTLLFFAFLAAALPAGCGSGMEQYDGTGEDGTNDYAQDQDWNVDVVAPDVPGDGDTDGTGDNCDEKAKWIYIVDTGNALIRFKPDDLSLTLIGTLNCPAPLGQTPFSMAVDRQATAWVLYANLLLGIGGGTLHKASTLDASCVSTTFAPSQLNMDVFGMGFVSNSPGSEDETLFVAGGPILSIALGSATLAILDTGTLTLQQVGTVPQWPELTGTGLAELWGFFPESTPPAVQMIDKGTGAVSNTYSLPTLDTGQTEAWAFAFWGGDFYLFLKTMMDASTNIWKLETDDGSLILAVPDTGYTIVGAGVSTCAPTTII
jgi:hypothetical protein